MLKKLFYLAILILLLGIFSMFSFKIKTQPGSNGNSLFASCKIITDSTEATKCYTNVILKQVRQNPNQTQSLFKSLAQNYRQPGFVGSASFHELAHETGELMTTVVEDPYEAFLNCGPEFQGGCYHGVVMTYIDATQPSGNFSFEKAFQFCEGIKKRAAYDQEYLHCVHGVGHIGIIKVKGDLNKALTGCDILKAAFSRHCYDGVFMEYSRGDTQTGLHIHNKPLGFIALPCKDLVSVYKTACYFVFGRLNPVLEKNVENYLGAEKLCDLAEEDYHYFCRLGLGERILLNAGYDMQKAANICASFGKYSYDCKQAIIIDKVYGIDQPKDPNNFCGQSTGILRNSCLQGEIAYYNFILP